MTVKRNPHTFRSSSGKVLRLSFCILTLLFSLRASAFAGQFSVSPIRLEFDARVKSSSITVSNQGADRLTLQMKGMEWTQDGGDDLYMDTKDIIFFPRIMTLEKGKTRIIRVGFMSPAAAREKTYRLFIEEIPEPRKAEAGQVTIAVRFGVPIFVKPVKEELKGEIGEVEMSNGNLGIAVSNKGNSHFSIAKVYIRGKDARDREIFFDELNGWYLLNGTSRVYTTSIPHKLCTGLARIDVEIKTDRFSLNNKFDVSELMCVPTLRTHRLTDG